MTTQEKIDQIIKDQYGDFKGRIMKPLQAYHNYMRVVKKPLKWWQYIILFAGWKVKREPLITDEQYLEFLEKAQKENPRPIYKIPEQIKALK